VIEDKSAGYVTAAGAHMVSFEPPADWYARTTANGPNDSAGYFIRCRMSAFTSVTADPVASVAVLYPLSTGAVGVPITVPASGRAYIQGASFNAATVSATNADSRFCIINTTQSTSTEVTWTKATQSDVATCTHLEVAPDDKIVVAQIQEDGTTEFAAASINLMVGTG
jgi:hypothetical protein